MAAAVGSREMKVVPVLRGIFRELRRATKKKPLSQEPAYRYLMEFTRRHKVTDQRICRAEMELRYMASTYHSYLSGIRKHQELLDRYHSRGERSVEETASMVGLGLPSKEDPR
ncbi:protein FMC1 homolog [Centruroides vittatus]|uniref:protein FMC1 homolog n=1 Tax=Centruroides vittatus TaxID=120091 RepID=UPI003510256B